MVLIPPPFFIRVILSRVKNLAIVSDQVPAQDPSHCSG